MNPPFSERRNFASFCVGVLVLTAWSAPAARASVTFTYTGNYFTYWNGFYYDPMYFSPYVKLTGYFTIASPLGDSLPLTDVIPLDFSFTDNLFFTITPANGYIPTFEIATDSSGNPVQWIIVATDVFGDDALTHNVPGFVSDLVDVPPSDFGNFAGVDNHPGTWVVTEDVPEPRYVFLTALALLGFASRARFPGSASRSISPSNLRAPRRQRPPKE